MPLNVTDKQVDELEKRGVVEGTKDGVTLTPSGDFSIKDRVISGVTADDIRKRLEAFQQTTTERRAKTTDRMEDLEKRTTPQEEQTTFGDTEVKDTTKKETTQTDEVTTTETDPYNIQSQIDEITAESKTRVNQISSTLDRIARQSSGAYNNLISSIKQIYGARIDEMEQANERLLSLKETVGIRQGRARYTPIVQGGILADEEIAGAERIAKLEGQMLQAVAEAEQAKADNDLKMFNEKYDKIDEVEKQMRDEITALYDNAVAQQEAYLEKKKEERLAQKEEFEQMLDKSERSAPSLVSAMADLETEEQKGEFISKYAEVIGVDPFVLLGDVEGAMTEQQKAETSIQNIKNQMYVRSQQEQRSQEDFETEKTEKEERDTLREQLLDALEKGEIDIAIARNAWGRAFPLEEFEREFGAFINEEE